MKTYLSDPNTFVKDNLSNWRGNTNFWLEAHLQHISDVRSLVAQLLQRVTATARHGFRVIDMGCGNAWILDMLGALNLDMRYLGLDFNDLLINELTRTRSSQTASFRLLDVQESIPADLIEAADLVINAFNFFELPGLQGAFGNAARMLDRGGALLLITVDPITQLISMADTHDDLRTALRLYANHGASLCYDKHVETAEGLDERLYKGILYKLSDYHRLAREYDMTLEMLEERLCIHDLRPQLYQVALWRGK